MNLKRNIPVLLCVLDGFGWREAADDNATTRARMPVFRKYWEKCPHSLLGASGSHVGLPDGQIGNSEVGHMNLGAGRVVLQDLPMIDRAIERDEIAKNAALRDFIAKTKQSGGVCHLMGLASDGGVHSHQNHIVELARLVGREGINVAVHAFLDGRDVPPQSAAEQIRKLENDLSVLRGARIQTVCGRYYAMDRDKRWDRVAKAYALLTDAEGTEYETPVEAIRKSYEGGVGDEFVLPAKSSSYKGMKDGDGILFANFRADRAREILLALLDNEFSGFERKRTINFAAAAGMVEYSDRLNNFMSAIFRPKTIENGLGELAAKAGMRQLRIAETEKYPHVTFFFNGGREEPYPNEDRIMVPSPKVATYDLQPEMSAREVTDKVIEAVNSGKYDLMVLNYANPDMVGHTGCLEAAVKALETVDECLGRVLSAAKENGWAVFVTADHGNCETMFDKEKNCPHTAHTLARVPAMLVNAPSEISSLKDGKLADVAPTLLELMGMDKPDEMDGESLLVV